MKFWQNHFLSTADGHRFTQIICLFDWKKTSEFIRVYQWLNILSEVVMTADSAKNEIMGDGSTKTYKKWFFCIFRGTMHHGPKRL
jgi:hypothetical protein